MTQKKKIFSDIVRIIISVLIISVVFFLILSLKHFNVRLQDRNIGFEGTGTRNDPYLISNSDDLLKLSMAVNGGNVFQSAWFIQTDDIDLSIIENWIPIGTFDNRYSFQGVYDGNGHTISNIHCDGYKLSDANIGLFGKLSGTVCNLGIESGEFKGSYIGSIASHSAADTAMIINCYNKANLLSTTGRCGGIADNFGKGKIICCVNYGTVSGDNAEAGIASYTAGTVYGCYSKNDQIYIDTFDGELINPLQDGWSAKDINELLYEAEKMYDLKNLKLKKW